MFRKLVPLAIVTLWGVVAMPQPQKASASTPLTRAVVKKLHNWVQLMPRNRPKRRARRRDTMNPGDGLATGRASLADLRFNDGSLARIGERAVFRFLPRTRTFKLSNGTVLLLIPPGQGRTRVRTRSAAATIRGSALFVRYDEQTDTTVVGSLTDSGIEVFNKDESRSQVLKAGQLIVVVKGRIQGLYNFDLRTFYDTSDLVRGLDLTSSRDTTPSDAAIASVQAETSEAVAKQEPIVGDKIVENPSFLELSPVASDQPSEQVADNLPVKTLVETGQVITDTSKKDDDESTSNNNNTLTPPSNSASPTPATPTNQPTTGSQSPTPATPSPTTPTKGGESPTPVTPSPEPSPTIPTTPTNGG
ncbi:MAG: FecR domain-containing protein, partial [Rivularia sp. (in: Bacteria)]|nr:FecR domain-containing protein [Rivularia sp. MS3]